MDKSIIAKFDKLTDTELASVEAQLNKQLANMLMLNSVTDILNDLDAIHFIKEQRHGSK